MLLVNGRKVLQLVKPRTAVALDTQHANGTTDGQSANRSRSDGFILNGTNARTCNASGL